MTCGIDSGCTGNCRQGRDCPSRASSARGNFWLLCIMLACFAGLLAIVGPAIDDHSGEMAQADEIANQIKRERREAMAAHNICGQNAGYRFDGNTLQCLTKRGAKTITAKVTP